MDPRHSGNERTASDVNYEGVAARRSNLTLAPTNQRLRRLFSPSD